MKIYHSKVLNPTTYVVNCECIEEVIFLDMLENVDILSNRLGTEFISSLSEFILLLYSLNDKDLINTLKECTKNVRNGISN